MKKSKYQLAISMLLLIVSNLAFPNNSFEDRYQNTSKPALDNINVNKIHDDTQSIINQLDNVARPKFIELQNLTLHIEENEWLTEIYNSLLKKALSDIEHYEKVEKEVSEEYGQMTNISSAINNLKSTINADEMDKVKKQFPDMFSSFNTVEQASLSASEAMIMKDDYRSKVISSPRKVFLTHTGFEHSPHSKYGDIYINVKMYEKYKQDEDTLTTILLHEAFHVLVMPELEHSQIVEGVLSSLVFSNLPRDKLGNSIDRKAAKKHMHEWSKTKSKGINEFEIDRLTMLHLRESKLMRQKYLSLLGSLPGMNPKRLAAATSLDKYMDDEYDVNVLEHNLINIKAGFMSSMSDLVKPRDMPPEFLNLQGKLYNPKLTKLEKEKIQLQIEKIMNQAYMPQYKLRPHAVSVGSDNYKEYMSIVIDEIKSLGNDGEF